MGCTLQTNATQYPRLQIRRRLGRQAIPLLKRRICVDYFQHTYAEAGALLPEKPAATHLPVAQHFSKLKGTSHISSLESHRVAKASERLSREQYLRVLPY